MATATSFIKTVCSDVAASRNCANNEVPLRGVAATAGEPTRLTTAGLSIIGDSSQAFSPFVRKWRNWQTRKPQELVAARSWRFKSSLPHYPSVQLQVTFGVSETFMLRNLCALSVIVLTALPFTAPFRTYDIASTTAFRSRGAAGYR